MSEGGDTRDNTAAGVAGVAVFIITLLVLAKAFHLSGGSSFVWFFVAAVVGLFTYSRLSKR